MIVTTAVGSSNGKPPTAMPAGVEHQRRHGDARDGGLRRRHARRRPAPGQDVGDPADGAAETDRDAQQVAARLPGPRHRDDAHGGQHHRRRVAPRAAEHGGQRDRPDQAERDREPEADPGQGDVERHVHAGDRERPSAPASGSSRPGAARGPAAPGPRVATTIRIHAIAIGSASMRELKAAAVTFAVVATSQTSGAVQVSHARPRTIASTSAQRRRRPARSASRRRPARRAPPAAATSGVRPRSASRTVGPDRPDSSRTASTSPAGVLGPERRRGLRQALLAHGPADRQHRRQRDRARQPVGQPEVRRRARGRCRGRARGRWSAVRGPPGATRTAARRAPRCRCRRPRLAADTSATVRATPWASASEYGLPLRAHSDSSACERASMPAAAVAAAGSPTVSSGSSSAANGWTVALPR